MYVCWRVLNKRDGMLCLTFYKGNLTAHATLRQTFWKVYSMSNPWHISKKVPAPLLLSHILAIKISSSSTITTIINVIFLKMLSRYNQHSVHILNNRAKIQHLSLQESLVHGVGQIHTWLPCSNWGLKGEPWERSKRPGHVPVQTDHPTPHHSKTAIWRGNTQSGSFLQQTHLL